MKSYIEEKKKLYFAIHEFIENSDEINDDELNVEFFQILTNLVKDQQIEGDPEEIRQFLEMIKSIGDHHHRNRYFNKKINQILSYYKDQIKQTLSNNEIFHIFESNKNIILFLLKSGIITISESICAKMMNKLESNGIPYWHFFIPEIEKVIGEEKMKSFTNELLKNNSDFLKNYEEKRQEGENDSYICSLIRQDSVVEFISYLNHHHVSHSSQIKPSIFETNSFLIEQKETTLIEYSAFFGSIQIFQYLLMNKVKLTPSLWLYSIHSNNAELIHLLENNNVPPPLNITENKNEEEYDDFEDIEDEDEEEKKVFNYAQCFIESIKCHHNNIADYIENNLLDLSEQNKEELIILNCIKYHNYVYFQIDMINNHGFFYLCLYHLDKLVELLLKNKEQEIKKKIIQ